MNIPISYKWLASHFEKGVPAPEEIARLFTLHLCEVEGMEKKSDDTIFDLKILPDRGHDLLAHKGIAREVSVLARIPLMPLPGIALTQGDAPKLSVSVEDQKLCPRYIGRTITGVTVGESPLWLRERLESVGQRSINNIVDITNFVMLELGQPMHAFDAKKVSHDAEGMHTIVVRPAHEGEYLRTLDNKELSLTSDTLVIADQERALAVAGIKGGKAAEVDRETTEVILESANFDSVNTRRTSARIGIRTDSSKRFEHGLAPALAEEGMALATALIAEVCPGAVISQAVDVALRPTRNYKVGISTTELNAILGTAFTENDVRALLEQLGFSYTVIENPQTFILEEAQKLVGKPYKYGASVLYDAPEAFDCSSFISYLYTQAGVLHPRISVDQFVFGTPVSESDMASGDLIFANTGILENKIYDETVEWMPGTKVPHGVDHVALYLGSGEVIQTARSKGGVVIEKLSESQGLKNIVGVRRITIKDEPRFVVTIPLERLDLRIKEDLAEELGRVYGFHNIPSTPLPNFSFTPEALKTYHYSNLIREALVSAGFSEIFTSSFQNEGLFGVENPIAEDKGFLRKDLATGIKQALVFNARNAPLIATDDIKLFEIGKVFPGVMQEKLSLAVGVELGKAGKKKEALTRETLDQALNTMRGVLGVGVAAEVQGGVFEVDLEALMSNLPTPPSAQSFKAVDVRYTKISPYPFILRDIALWVPEGVTSESVLLIITREAGELLRVKRLFDVFTKEFPEGKKTSYAYNLAFQSYEKTLSDEEINAIMTRITDALVREGYTVR